VITKRSSLAAAFCAFLFAALAPAQPKPAPAPDTYSFTAVSSLIGPKMTIQVNRNGSKELIERTAFPRPGVAQPFQDRVLYDFQLAAMERPDGTHPPRTTGSGRVNYGVTCRK
jgi:hypothetical protein